MALSPLARSATARRRVKSATGFRLNRGKLHSGGASTVSKFRWSWGRTVRAASLRPGVSKYKFTVVTKIRQPILQLLQSSRRNSCGWKWLKGDFYVEDDENAPGDGSIRCFHACGGRWHCYCGRVK